MPFAYVHEPESRNRAQTLIGKEIIFSAYSSIQLLDVDGALDPAAHEEIQAMKVPDVVHVHPKTRFGAYSASTTDLVPSDIRYFGGKAANFGLLRRTIPSNSPPAIAFSMDLWDDFLDQTLPGGLTLRAEIKSRLDGLTYPPQMVNLQSNLATIQSLIRSTATFNATQRAAILAALQQFDPLQNIRFRSSSNAEDSESFTAAGLLDSYSGCVADDTDSDARGPSRCDPTELNERGVFRAMQRVYASFYNENAFLERLRHQINEDEVGVGVLVHHSFPDQIELANGVATVDYTSDLYSLNVRMVTQPGAASVTNPDPDAQAEDVSLRVDTWQNDDSIYGPYISSRSSLVPVGQTVLPFGDYVAFAKLFRQVEQGYLALFPAKTQFTLDLEYKKIVPDWLVIKQVREIPQPPSTNVVPFLINKPVELCAFEGEQSQLYVNHAFKCRGTVQTKNIRMTDANLAEPFFSRIQLEFVRGTNIWQMEEDTAAWTNIDHRVEGDTVTDVFPATANRPAITLVSHIRRAVGPNESPFLTIESLTLARAADEPVFTPEIGVGNFQSPIVNLVPCPTVTSNSFLQTREATVPNAQLRVDPELLGDVTVQTRYYWPDPVGIVRNDNTAPLVRFVDTTITGVTTTPIVLAGNFSQSYWPVHHNYYEFLLFDPWLEPGLSSDQREELASVGIWWFLLQTVPGSKGGFLYAFDLNGTFRQLGNCNGCE